MSIAERPRAEAAAADRADRVPSAVRQRLESLRRRTLRQRALIDLGRGVLLAGALLAALVWLDNRLELPWAARAIGLLGAIGAVVWTAVQAARQRYNYTAADAAADVESHYPQYGQRIRTSRDYGDPDEQTAPAAPGIVSLMQADTQLYTADVDFGQVARSRPVWLTWLAVGAALVLGLACLLANSELWISLGRALLLPLQYTQVTVTPLDQPVRAGQDAVIAAEVTGRPVRQAELLYRPSGSQQPWTRLPLLPVRESEADTEADAEFSTAEAGNPKALTDSRRTLTNDAGGEQSPGENRRASDPLVGQLLATIADCQEDLEYKVVAGPLDSQVWQLRVLQPLEMQQFTAHVESPAYTGRAPETTESLDLKVIEGATVRLDLIMNRSPADARLIPLDENGQPLADQAREVTIAGTHLQTTLPAMKESLTCLITAAAADGITFESPRLRIQVQPDARPRVRFVEPAEDLEVIPTTEVTLAVEAGDDFGLRQVGILYQIGDEPPRTLWSQQFDADQPREMQVRPVLSLEQFPLTHQDAVTYHAFVEDNHPDGPRRTTTELRFIDIRPFKREYEILPASGGT
ncbi:MAG: hypothetical protein J5I93_26510 [Pirellulaceae bacterium]|nr:hypothetical protein [Pirellulaceae bacterium]